MCTATCTELLVNHQSTGACTELLVNHQSTGLRPSRLILPPIDWIGPQSTDLTAQHHESGLSSISFSKAPTSRPFHTSSSANILPASERPQIPAQEITQHHLG